MRAISVRPAQQSLLGRPQRQAVRVRQAAESSTATVQYKHLMLTILDANPYLSDGSRLALATAASMSKTFGNSKVTVLVVDEPGTDKTDPAKRLESIAWHLKDKGCSEYELMERATQHASVLMGDVADEIAADMLLVSSEAVHAKHVDANQLAEFVSCPVLLLP